MRWYFESNDEPKQYIDIRYEGGLATLAVGTVGDDEPDEFRETPCATEEDAVAAVMPRVRELLAQGFVASVPPEERFAPDPTIHAYWETRFVEELRDRFDITPRDEPLDYGERMIAYMAVEPSDELLQFLTIRSEWNFGYTNFGEWRIWDQERWLPDPEQGNLFEQIVVMDQNNYLGTALLEFLSNFVFLGTAGNGDVYFGHQNPADPGQCEVVFWNHETQQTEFVFADSLSSFAWTNHLYCRLEDDDFDHDEVAADMALIADRVNVSWHYSSLVDEASVEPEYESNSRAIYYAYRAMWLIYLLRNNRVQDVEDCAEMFWPDIHAPLKFEDAEKGPYLQGSTITGLYWLWRLWFFDKKEQLGRCLEVLRGHRSPVVRDAAKLVKELEDGRRELGTIEDMHALRQQWLDLDIDPERAEERAAEEAKEARRQQQELARDLEAAHAFLAEAPVAAVREALWDPIKKPDVLDVYYEHLEHHDPDIQPWLDRWDFIANQGASRDGKFFSFEVDEVLEVIEREGAVLAPRLFAEGRGVDAEIAAARAGGEPVRPRLKQLLSQRSKYFSEVRVAVEGLVKLGDSDLVDELLELVDELMWEQGDFHSRIERGDAFKTVVEALGQLGDASALDTLSRLATDGPDEVVPRAIVALGRIGDPSSIDLLTELLESDHARPAAWSLARIADPDALAVLNERTAQFAGAAEGFAYETVMLERARLSNGEEVDFDVVRWATGIVESKMWEDIEMHETLVELLSASEGDEATELLADYLQHQHRRVRSAAIEALRSRGELPELRWLDRPTTDRLFAEEGVEGLREALADPHAIFRVNALRKAAEEGVGEAVIDEACELVELLTRFDHYTNGYAEDVHDATAYAIGALARFEDDAADRLLCRLLMSGNAMYQKPFQYAEDLRDRVVRFADDVVTDDPDGPPTLAAEPISQTPWLFGALINAVAWSPSGDILAAAGEGGVTIFDPQGQRLRIMDSIAGGWIYDVDFHPHDRRIAIGAHAGHLRILDPDSGDELAKLKGHAGVPNGVRKVRFSPDGARLASVSDDQTLRIWDLESGACEVVHGDSADVNGVDWFDDELLVIATDRMVRVMSVEGTEVASVSTGAVAEVRVTPDREYVYVGASAIRVFDRELQERPDDALQQASVVRMRFSADGAHLFAASWDGDDVGVSKWSLAERTRQRFPGHDDAAIFGMDLHPDGTFLVAGGRHSTVYRWTPDGELQEHDDVFHTGEVGGIRRAGDWILTAGDDATAIRWDVDGNAQAVYESPDGQMLTDVVADRDRGRVYVCGFDFAGGYDLDSGALIWQAAPSRAEYLEVVEDAVVVASGSQLLWLDPDDGRTLHESEPFADSFIFWWARLDDRRLAVAGYDDERLFVWDLIDREEVDVWELPASERGGLRGVAHAAGTDRVFVSRWDKSVIVLDATSGEVVKRAALGVARAPIAVVPDGSAVVTGVGGRLDVHDPDTFEVRAMIAVPSELECMAIDDHGWLFGGAKSGNVFRAMVPRADDVS